MFRAALLLITIPLFLVFPQQSDSIVAKIGNIEISKQEFQKRYELTPFQGKEIKSDIASLKKKVLYSLIAEKLFSLKAREMNIDTSEIVARTLAGYKKMFVRDALYKKVIRQRAAKTADSLLTLYLGKASEIWFTYISAQDKQQINNIYALLKKGVPFDSVYNAFASIKDTLKTRIGDHDPAVEDEIFSLREQEFSKPLLMDNNWYILKIVKRINPVLTQMNGWEEDYKRLKQTAQERAEGIYYKEFMVNFFKDKKIRADGNLLKLFADKVSDILKEKAQTRKSDTDKVYINNIDLIEIENEIGPEKLNSVYIDLNSRPVTLKDFILHFRFEPIGAAQVDAESVFNLLNSKTRQFIEQELLAEEGFKEGLDKLPSVEYSYKMWRDNYYFYLIENMFNDSTAVSDKEVLDYYAAEGKKDNLGEEIKISRISVDSLETIEKILDEIDDGNSFELLAEKYSGENSTEGYAPAASFGEIGRISESMKPGEVYGPIKTGDKYILFKLLERRNKEKQGSFESEKENIRKTLEQVKFRDKLVNFTTSLAMKYGFSINQEALSDISVTSINSMVYQMLGFGGKIPAVPLSLPAIQWYNNWKEKHDIIQ